MQKRKTLRKFNPNKIKDLPGQFYNWVSSLSRRDLLRYCILFFAVASPFIFVSLIMAREGQHLFNVLPTINDESGYYLQLKSMLRYGAPLGYNGYNGGTAPVSTFGFHGFFVFIPYYLFAKVFGLHYYTITLCGLLMMSGSILFYILVLRPSNRQLAFLIMCSSAALYYAQTAMMESGFYAYMIAFAAILLRIAKKDDENNSAFIKSGYVFITFVSLAKPTFAIFILPLLMLTIKHKNLIVRAALSFAGMAAFTGAAYVIFSVFSSPFSASHMAVDSNPGFAKTVFLTIKSVAKCFYDMILITVSLKSVWGLLSVILVFFTAAFLAWFCLAELINHIKNKSLNEVRNDSLLMISSGASVTGLMILWTGLFDRDLTTVRNCIPVFFFAMAVISGLKIRKKASFMSIFAIVHSAVMIIGGSAAYGTAYEHRNYVTPDYVAKVQQVEIFYGDSIMIAKKNSRWENTIADHTSPEIYWLNAPAGAGWNMHIRGCSTNEKYVLLRVSDEEVYDHYAERGYIVINQNEEVVLMLNPKYE